MIRASKVSTKSHYFTDELALRPPYDPAMPERRGRPDTDLLQELYSTGLLVELLVDEELLLELEPELEPVLLEPPEPVLGGGVVDDPPEPPPEPPVDPLPPGGGGGGGGALSASAGDAAASIAPVTSRMVRFLRAPMFPMPLSASPGCGLGRCTTSSVPVPAVVGNWSF